MTTLTLTCDLPAVAGKLVRVHATSHPPLPEKTLWEWTVTTGVAPTTEGEREEPSGMRVLPDEPGHARFLPRQPGSYIVSVTATPPSDDHDTGIAASVTIDVAEQPAPPTEGVSDAGTTENEYWRKRLTDDAHNRLTDIQKAATTWQGYTAGLLGLFSAVAFLAGPKTITDVKPWWVALVGLAAIVFAVGFAWHGLALIARITASGVHTQGGVTPDDYRRQVEAAADTAQTNLQRSQQSTKTAAFLVAAGSIVIAGAALVAGATKPAEPSRFIVRSTNGQVWCGTLSTTSTGQALLNGRPLTDVADIQGTDSCGG